MNFIKKLFPCAAVILSGLIVSSCNDSPSVNDEGLSETKALNDGSVPSFSQSIVYWNGEKADDKSSDSPENDGNIYHEANTFSHTVRVDFSEDGANVNASDSRILTHTEGGYVTIDFQTNNISGVNIILSGSTSDGGLKIYGSSKFRLDLNDVSIVSQKGPAINSQCKKRMFVNLADGSSNKLVDAAEYSNDSYYLSSNSPESEDRKGCLFSEGNVIFSGNGVLEVQGKNRHGIATDGYMIIRPGTTVAVTEARNNCVHIKGSTSEAKGLWMKGGLLYCLATSSAGKAVKSDENIVIDGGKMILNTSGDAIVDNAENDTSSASCLKTDSFVEINGGDIALRSTGLGGKGINASAYIKISGGSVRVSTSGEKYFNGVYTSSPKGLKATEGIYINGGDIIVLATGNSDGAKAIESDGSINISDGSIDVYSFDDAVNALKFDMNGGILSAYSIEGDGIRGKESVTVSSGRITAAAGAQSCGISCNTSELFRITGGNVFALGGELKSSPSPAGVCRTFNDITISKNQNFNLIGSDKNLLISFKSPRTYTNATVIVASDVLNAEAALSTTVTNQ